MIRFAVAINSKTIDVNALKQDARNNLLREFKIAGLAFASGMLTQIPSYNPALGGANSLFSTGFVAGTVKNIVDAASVGLEHGKADALGGTLKEIIRAQLTSINPYIKAVQATPSLSAPETLFSTRKREHAHDIASSLSHRTHDYQFEPGSSIRHRTFLRKGNNIIRISNAAKHAPNVFKIKINPYYGKKSAGILKTPLSAAVNPALATPPQNIFTTSGNSVIFLFQTNISYFNIQDITHHRSGPWKAYATGKVLFNDYIKYQSNLKNIIPRIDNYILVRQYIVDYNGNISRRTQRTRPLRTVTSFG